ncbi:hypothetical protein ACPPVO_43355 [Dactylosporangium sp. McL0621]|uniref:hypothetical protein n=1 Tax=Dactylosporangium sp. McL0621 TaxID=3415678 RepID=UPI003CFAB5F6
MQARLTVGHAALLVQLLPLIEGLGARRRAGPIVRTIGELLIDGDPAGRAPSPPSTRTCSPHVLASSAPTPAVRSAATFSPDGEAATPGVNADGYQSGGSHENHRSTWVRRPAPVIPAPDLLGTGDWRTYKEISFNVGNLPAGTRSITAVMNADDTADVLDLDWFRFV